MDIVSEFISYLEYAQDVIQERCLDVKPSQIVDGIMSFFRTHGYTERKFKLGWSENATEIRMLRQQLGLTRAQLAKYVGVNQDSVRHCEDTRKANASTQKLS